MWKRRGKYMYLTKNKKAVQHFAKRPQKNKGKICYFFLRQSPLQSETTLQPLEQPVDDWLVEFALLSIKTRF